MTIFLLTTHKAQKAVDCSAMIFFFFFLRTPTSPRKYWVWGLHRNDLFFEITNVFFEISVVKRWPSQSLSYGIFTKTLGHFRTFSSAYADSENLEETLAVAIPKQGQR